LSETLNWKCTIAIEFIVKRFDLKTSITTKILVSYILITSASLNESIIPRIISEIRFKFFNNKFGKENRTTNAVDDVINKTDRLLEIEPNKLYGIIIDVISSFISNSNNFYSEMSLKKIMH
jgi:hypothetical protein